MNNSNKTSMKIIIVMIALSAFVGLTVSAKEKTEKVLIDKKYEVNKGALLRIEHQYGTVECKNWNESAISVKVIARVETSNAEEAERIFDAIKIIIDGNRNGVSVESEYSNKAFKNDNNGLSVDIEIFVPVSVRLQLEHQFGNAYIEAISGETEISIEYGSLEVIELKSETNNIEIGFGDADIGNIRVGDIEIDYANVEIGKSESLEIESNYSDISIDKVGVLEIENEGGKVEIGKVGEVNMTSKFSDFQVGELATNLSGETEYGSFSIKKVRAGFSNIAIKNSFGAVSIYFEPGSVFGFEAELEFCTLNYPDEMANFNKRIVSSTSGSYYSGIIGKGTSKGSKVDITSEYGGVSIFFR